MLAAETRRAKAIDKMFDDRSALFATIWTNMSIESRDKVEQEENFAEIELSRDPKLLLDAIRRTHLAANTGTEVLDKKIARRDYQNCKHISNLRLNSTMDSFENCLQF